MLPAENRNTTALRLRWRRCIQRIWSGLCRAGRKSIWSSRRSSGMGKVRVKIRAESPSLHFIRATVVTKSPRSSGQSKQAKDLIGYIDETLGKQDGIWETNIFGKTVERLVNDGIRPIKISMIGEESQEKSAGYDAKDRQRFDGRNGVSLSRRAGVSTVAAI